MGTSVDVSSICYYIELLVYNAASVARIIVLCQHGCCGLDGLRFLSQMIIFKFSARWEGEFISYIPWCRVLWRLPCVYADERSMSRLKNRERLRPSSCVRGGNYLWCSAATIVHASACSDVFSVWAQLEILQDWTVCCWLWVVSGG